MSKIKEYNLEYNHNDLNKKEVLIELYNLGFINNKDYTIQRKKEHIKIRSASKYNMKVISNYLYAIGIKVIDISTYSVRISGSITINKNKKKDISSSTLFLDKNKKIWEMRIDHYVKIAKKLGKYLPIKIMLEVAKSTDNIKEKIKINKTIDKIFYNKEWKYI